METDVLSIAKAIVEAFGIIAIQTVVMFFRDIATDKEDEDETETIDCED